MHPACHLAGQALLRLAWRNVSPLIRQRLIGTEVGALIPLHVLLVHGISLSFSTPGSNFCDCVNNNWQPILAQGAMFAAILGFYIPGLLKISTEITMEDEY